VPNAQSSIQESWLTIVFRRTIRLGFTRRSCSGEPWALLWPMPPRSEILCHVAAHGSAAIGRLDEFGQRYTIDFTLITEVGAAAIRSAWIVRAAEDFPRLTTCYVLPA
jgi:hypothetical protein